VDVFRGTVLAVATVTMGLMAGVFVLYAHTIMRGLRKVDDRTFVSAFQAIDRAIINPLFMATFVGALLGPAVASVLSLPAGERSVLPWSGAAFVLYLLVFVTTISVNVPMNDALKAAGDPDRIDTKAARARFGERRWSRWNLLRAVLTSAAFISLVYALVEHGQNS
jgi:uncharacterized membrane protein